MSTHLKKRNKAIIFDIDNTLLNDDYAVEAACKKIYDSMLLPINFNSFLKAWFKAIEAYFPKYLKGEITFQEQRIYRVQQIFSPYRKLDKDLSLSLFKNYLAAYEANWKLFKEVKSIIHQLSKHYKLGIISNGKKEQQLQKLKATGIISYFSSIIISSDFDCKKPNPKLFDYASKELMMPHRDCYYIGDKIETDVLGAANTGMTGIWINRKNQLARTGILEIQNLEQLAQIIIK